MGLMAGKKCLITGIANKRSIAWAIAQAFHREGAELAFTYQGDRLKENLDELLPSLGPVEGFPTYNCDVTRDEDIAAVFAALQERWGSLNVLVHSVAYSPTEELNGRVVDISRKGYGIAQDISAYSLIAMAKHAEPLLEAAGGGSIMSMTYIASGRVVEKYSNMAFAKASLENITRYLAADLGTRNIRVNAISAGPLKTLAASAVKGITHLRDLVEERAPLRRNITQDEVGDVALFLGSDLSRCVTGHVLMADNGFSVMGV